MNLSIPMQTQMTIIAGAVILLALFVAYVIKSERKLKKTNK